MKTILRNYYCLETDGVGLPCCLCPRIESTFEEKLLGVLAVPVDPHAIFAQKYRNTRCDFCDLEVHIACSLAGNALAKPMKDFTFQAWLSIQTPLRDLCDQKAKAS